MIEKKLKTLCINKNCSKRMNCMNYIAIAHIHSKLIVGEHPKKMYDSKNCTHFEAKSSKTK